MKKNYLTVSQYARKNGISTTTVHKAVKSDRIAYVVIDGHIKIDAGEPWVQREPGRPVKL